MRVFQEIRRPLTDAPLGVDAFRTDTLAFKAHWHHDVEIILSTGGEIPVGIGGRMHRMREGDLAIVGSGEIHWYEGAPGACDIRLAIVPSQVTGHGCWPSEGRFVTPFFSSNPENLSEGVTLLPASTLETLRLCFLDIFQEFPLRDLAHEDLMRARIGLFCGMALRLLPMRDSRDPGERRRRDRMVRVQEALEWVEEHFREEISLEDLAERMNMGYHHLSRVFGETVGNTFPQHLNRIRIEEADRLLMEGNRSITEIALECGFNSLRTFNRAYRTLRGRSPSEAGYRPGN